MMKQILIVLISTSIFIINSCNTSPVAGEDKQVTAKADSHDVTGVKQIYNGSILKKEVTYLNGIKEGLCKNYYDDGRLKRTIWYSNNLKEDTAKWYYSEGMVYRATPYRNDNIHGIQTKYYRSGRIMAEIPYRNGLRLPGLKEYYDNGLEVGNIPGIEILKINTDSYEDDGYVTVSCYLSNKSKNVKFYVGGLVDGAFDDSRAREVTAANGMAFVELKRVSSGGSGYLDVIAVYTTRFRNSEIIIRRIKLPYNDLKNT